jgi:DNA-binding GntR family transcriptional regulator
VPAGRACALLEVEAARLGADAVSREECIVMLQLCVQLQQAVAEGDIVKAIDLDEEILTILYTAAGNAVAPTRSEERAEQKRCQTP